VVGVVKAYITRVGEGPMPTELKGSWGRGCERRGRVWHDDRQTPQMRLV